ncbi:MAG: hypothetical protein JRF64_04520 [Deltaproteobacteria bacterium]|nr:hypothetical protein [Deltaproteobacteria bacterium]
MKKFASHLIISLTLIVSMASGLWGDVPAVYQNVPPFLTTSVPPNLLLLIDNSASMYDLAYIDTQKHCYDDSYNIATTYAGYCEPTTWYKYDLGQSQFEPVADGATAVAFLAAQGGTRYINPSVAIAIDETVTPNGVKGLIAIGNFVNWVTASKFDIEKKILTGGKLEATGTYGAPNDRLVMENRGCLNNRFVKQVAVTDFPPVSTFYLTLGVGGPEEPDFPAWEDATVYEIGDVVTDITDLFVATSNGTSAGTGVVDDTGVSWAAYTLTRWTAGAVYPADSIVSDDGEMYINATAGTATGTGVADDSITWDAYNVTHIEIFAVTTDGFDNTGCQSAVEEMQKDSPNQGLLKGYIDSCLGYEVGVGGQSKEADSNGAFNHSLHNCWYMAKQGSWPPGAGPETTIKNDCDRIYTNWGTPPWSITVDDMGYACFGIYDSNPVAGGLQPSGYVGRCWNPGVGAACNCTLWDNPIQCPGVADVPPDPACCKKWNCVGGVAAGWDASGYADIDTCIRTALQDYCGILEIPEVVDPTDEAGETGEFWNIPAVLIDSGARPTPGDHQGSRGATRGPRGAYPGLCWSSAHGCHEIQ